MSIYFIAKVIGESFLGASAARAASHLSWWASLLFLPQAAIFWTCMSFILSSLLRLTYSSLLSLSSPLGVHLTLQMYMVASWEKERHDSSQDLDAQNSGVQHPHPISDDAPLLGLYRSLCLLYKLKWIVHCEGSFDWLDCGYIIILQVLLFWPPLEFLNTIINEKIEE